MKRRLKLIALTAAGAAICSPTPADAQVFVDPGSPSGKEYAIPLEDARREASPGGNEDPVVQGDRSAPLFGEGVEPDAGRTADGAGTGKNKRSPLKDGSPDGSRAAGSVDSLDRSGNVVATVPQGGFGDTLTIGVVALSVLLLGGVLGSVARRRSF